MVNEAVKTVSNQQQYFNPYSMGGCYPPMIMDDFAGLDNDIFSPMGSVFNGNDGMMGGYPMGGMGFGGMYGYGKDYEKMRNMSFSEYANYQAEQQQDFYKNGVHRQKDIKEFNNAAQFSLNADDNVLADKANVLKELIEENEQENIKVAYDDFKNKINEILTRQGQKPTKEELNTAAQEKYKEIVGENLIQSIRENGNGTFAQGLIEGTGVGYFINHGVSTSDNVSHITGKPQSKIESAERYFGMGIAGVATFYALPHLVTGAGVGSWKIAKSTGGSWLDLGRRCINPIKKLFNRGTAEKLAKAAKSIK